MERKNRVHRWSELRMRVVQPDGACISAAPRGVNSNVSFGDSSCNILDFCSAMYGSWMDGISQELA